MLNMPDLERKFSISPNQHHAASKTLKFSFCRLFKSVFKIYIFETQFMKKKKKKKIGAFPHPSSMPV